MAQDGQSFLQVDFSFVADPTLRRILEEFHREAAAVYERGQHIASVFLSGGILEGVLTFALNRREAEAKEKYRELRRQPRELPEWSLEDLITVAQSLNLIGEGPAKAAHAVRDFRNLIHPERLARRSRPRWDALATMSLAAVAEVNRSLSGRMST